MLIFELELSGSTGEEGIKKWRNVLFSDESKYLLFGHDGRIAVRWPSNTAYLLRYTRKTVKYGGGEILVWGSFFGMLLDLFIL